MKAKIATVATAGMDRGMVIFQKVSSGLQPSISAASSSSSGRLRKN